MTVQRGRELVVSIDDGSGSFLALAGLAARELGFATMPVDGTSLSSAGRWRQLVPGAAARQARLLLDGVFSDQPADLLLRQSFVDGTARLWRVLLPGFARVEAPFVVTALAYRGGADGRVTYELTAESAGFVSFTAI